MFKIETTYHGLDKTTYGGLDETGKLSTVKFGNFHMIKLPDKFVSKSLNCLKIWNSFKIEEIYYSPMPPVKSNRLSLLIRLP